MNTERQPAAPDDGVSALTQTHGTAPVMACRDLHKHYTLGPQTLEVLRGVSLAVAPGERVAIIGSSGSGKSTLLNLLGGLDSASRGVVEINGRDIHGLAEAERCALRNRTLGFVYQFHHLLREFSAQENVAMPLLIRGLPAAEAARTAQAMLQRVGLGERLGHRPSALSGGERQRVAIARALVGQPLCVLMDEPTGNLDRDTAATIHTLMDALNAEFGTSFVVVTHDPQLAARMDRTLHLERGELREVTHV